ncbi:NACHT, LRR and PYD domains-containing protein 3-like [Clarias gariepinus]|uniref:NACHT, LRR and PYD domains-containing protein 3-like n=1 Tax=Clarias gariepinus TaxID=13013 RepID=UPI00234C54A2|nr:NACHT, LRR and PYD domains-containing protein 3-like [Clarias gariepinus]
MTRSTVILVDALDELKEDEFERFVFFLAQSPPVGFERIPRGKLDKKSREKVIDELIMNYKEDNALLVTIGILKEMKKNQLASVIEEQMKQKRKMSDPNTVPIKKQKLANAPNQSCPPDKLKNTTDKGIEQDLHSLMTKHKNWLKMKHHFIIEETAKDKKKIPLNGIYTDLIITKGESEARDNEHEILMNENSQFLYETKINCNDIFGPNEEEIKTVLTKGVAGIGKTVSVQKFILDWAENKANQDIMFLFVLPFRQLNLIKSKPDDGLSLHELLVHFHPALKGCHSEKYVDKKILFIFDGLEESRIEMSFRQAPDIYDVNAKSTVEALIINIINRNLLPSALIWITSRPAAANQIPSQHIDLVTEIQGFSDSQKEEYFRKRVADDQANRIISHIRTARSLYIMCHIPVFCWISVTALQPWLTRKCKEEIPTTLTEMYSHFLLVQMNRKNEKFDENPEMDSQSLLESNKKMILKLAELAFKQLQKGNVLFYETDLNECGIDVQESFLYSGLCTEIFKMESAFYRRKVYCFVHLSFQEFFAALHVFYCYLSKNIEEVKMFLPKTKAKTSEIHLDVLMKHAVDEALKSKNGHLDLFLRFLHGMSLESNQRLLQGVLPQSKSSSESIKKIKQTLKRGQKKNINPERWLNLSHCLIEMKDDTLQQEIQTYLKSKNKSKKLTLAHCSAMANMFQVSEEVMDELDLKKYNTTEEGRRRLIPALRNCKKAILADCNLSEKSCENIASALQSANSPLIELDLSNNDLQDEGLKLLYEGLKSTNCKLRILCLSNCKLTKFSCEVVASALKLRKSSLRNLDLSHNDLQKGINQLCIALKNQNCKLDTLRISDSKLTVESCQYIGPAIAKSPLRELDLSCNNLGDAGMNLLSDGLRSLKCKLNILKLSDCKLTEQSCTDIYSFLHKSNSSLRELDLSDNDLLDSGVKTLSAGFKSSGCVLEILRLSGCCLTARSCSSLTSALESNPTHLTELDLSYNHLGLDSEWEQLLSMKRSSVYKLETIKMDQRGELRKAPGLKKYACKLTLDPSTAHTRLSLTTDNTRMTLMREDQPCQNSRQRFQYATQVLCRESLSGRCYWEVEWHQGASIAVAYKSISKKGRRNDCLFGHSKKSWSLEFENDYSCSVVHNNKSTVRSHLECNRVGVYVDCPAGILSFYAISAETLTLIHTFRTVFIEPLFAGFGLKDGHASISLIHP